MKYSAHEHFMRAEKYLERIQGMTDFANMNCLARVALAELACATLYFGCTEG